MKGRVSKRTIEVLRPGETLFDTGVQGFVARRLPSGRMSYGLKYVDRETGRQRWFALGIDIKPDQARRMAEAERGRIAGGADPQSEREAARRNRTKIGTVDSLLDAHLKLYVEARHLRCAREIRRCFDRYVRPKIGNLPVNHLRRGHIVDLLDGIEADNGPVMADRVLAHVRKALNWHAARDEDFVVPIVRGMGRSRTSERTRKRILNDEEIRALWEASELTTLGRFGALVRVLLLTAQRREEVGAMCWSEIKDDIWTIPGARTKNKRTNDVQLVPEVQTLLASLPALGEYVFGQTGRSPYGGYSKSKTQLDEGMLKVMRRRDPNAKLEHWVLHDLRRTSRTLMSRAGVPSEIAERVVNHVIPGVEGVYNRHDYAAEKRKALQSLATLLQRIVRQDSKIIPIRKAQVRRS